MRRKELKATLEKVKKILINFIFGNPLNGPFFVIALIWQWVRLSVLLVFSVFLLRTLCVQFTS
jgi:hypothetical protein